MSIKDFNEKIKPLWRVLVSVLLCVLSFGLGRLSYSTENKAPLAIVATQRSIENRSEKQAPTPVSTSSPILGEANTTVVASKTGTKYYFPWCGSANRIKPENKISFASVALARESGYTPAANCKGLK